MNSHYFSLKNLMLVFILLCSGQLYAQEKSDSTKEVPKVVKGTFEDGLLINNQTVQGPSKKSLGLIFQHRFGLLENADDMFGIFAPGANIRFGFIYGITSNLSVSIAATKNDHLYDGGLKYIILRQSAPHGMPVTITYYGNAAISASPTEGFNNQDSQYHAANRLSYFNEIMIARKFNSHLSLQLAPTYTHFNIVDSAVTSEHNIIGVSFAGRYKFSPQSSVMIEFDYPITTSDINPQKPNFGIGYEVSTGSHQFQVFLCSSDGILGQNTMMYNQNEFWSGKFLIGFNITRYWSF